MNKLVELLESERPVYPETMYDIGYNNGLTMAIAIAGKLELEEVVHARWAFEDLDQIAPGCSRRGMQSIMRYPRCPHCGAHMDGGKEDV